MHICVYYGISKPLSATIIKGGENNWPTGAYPFQATYIVKAKTMSILIQNFLSKLLG
jgi:hypothetical protein